MKKLFTLFALLTVFLSASAKEITDVEIDFSKYTDISEVPRFSWGGSGSAWDRLSIKDGCLHFHSEEATDPSWDCQFFPIGGVDAEVGVTYTLHFKVKGDHAAGVSMLGFGQTPYGQFQITTSWVEGTVDYECTDANGNILMQCGDWIGDWDIAYLKITHDGVEAKPAEWVEILTNGDAEKSWEELGLDPHMTAKDEDAYKICFWTKEKGTWDAEPVAGVSGDAHPAKIEEIDGNHVFVCHAQLADTEGDPSAWDNQVWFESPREWKTGEKFQISFRYKASKDVSTNSQFHKKAPGDYLFYQAIGDINFTTEWQTFEKEITVPSDANGAWSVALNLNPNVKEAVDFYFDDITWKEMKLDHGLFVAGTHTESGLVPYNYAAAEELVWDEEMMAYAATVGKAGDPDSYVNELTISTVRGDDRQFKANALKVKGTIDGLEDTWLDYEASSGAKIELPAQGVWTVYIDTDATVMALVQVEGDEIILREPIEVTPNETEIVVAANERAMTMDEAKAEGLIADPANPTDEEKALYNGQPWDNQFFIVGSRALKVGEEVVVAFDYKAEIPATVGTQNSQGQGGYLHWEGLGNIEFTTEWQHFEQTITIPADTKGNQDSWTFNLSNMKGANTYYFKNFIFKTSDNLWTLIDMEGEGENNFFMKISPELPTAIKTVNVATAKTGKYNDGTKIVIVRNGKSYNVAGVEVK